MKMYYVCMCVFVHEECMYVYIYVFMPIYIYIHTEKGTCGGSTAHVCNRNACVYVCICIDTYIHTH
jgi:hypothetical protein